MVTFKFLDDTLIFSSYDFPSLQNIKRTMWCFELIPRLKVNFHKSSITRTIVISSTASNPICRMEGCHLSIWAYLFVHLHLMWKTIVNRINSKLAAWKGRHLSIGERVCLLKSIINNLPIYNLSLFPIPSTVATKIEKHITSFFGS